MTTTKTTSNSSSSSTSCSSVVIPAIVWLLSGGRGTVTEAVVEVAVVVSAPDWREAKATKYENQNGIYK